MSCHEYTSISPSVPTICAADRIQAIPPHSVNSASESTSAVTRETNTPRFSLVCSAIDSSWMCAKVRTRSSARAASLAVTRRRADRRPATYATTTSTKATLQMP